MKNQNQTPDQKLDDMLYIVPNDTGLNPTNKNWLMGAGIGSDFPLP